MNNRSHGQSGLTGRRLLGRLAAVLAAVALLIGMTSGTPAVAADGALAVTVSITDTDGNPISVVDASQIAAYRVRISYGCNGADCTDAKVVVAPTLLDPYAGTRRKETAVTYTPPFSPAPPLTGNIAAGYTIDLGTVTAGTSGVIRLDYTVNTRLGTLGAGNFFPDGSPITPEVTASASNAPSVTGTASATWKSYVPTPALRIVTSAPRINTDLQLTVEAASTSGCWSTVNGVLRSIPYNLCADSGQLTIDLPPKAQYVSSGGNGVYDAASHSVTFTTGPNAYRGQDDSTVVVTFPSSAYPTAGDACVATETFTAHDATLTYLDGSPKVTNPTTAQATVTVGNCAPFAKGSLAKTAYVSASAFPSTNWNIPTSAAGNYNVFWQVVAANQANVPGVATIVDNALDQPDLPVTNISVVAGGPADIEYTLDDGTSGTATGVTSYAAPAGRHFVAATLTSSTLAGPNVKQTDTGVTNFIVRFVASLKNGATPGTRTNTSTATVTYPDYPELGSIVATGSPVSRTVNLINPVTPYTLSASNLSATVTGGGIALVGSEVVWTDTGMVSNLVSGTSLTPQYVYLAPLGWDIKPNGASLVTDVPGATFDYRTVSYSGNSYQAVIVNWPSPTTSTGSFNLPQLSVKTVPTGAAGAGTNDQTGYFFVGDAGNGIADAYTNVKVTDTTDVDADGVTTDVFSRDSSTTSLAASPSIGLTKEICRPSLAAPDGCDWVSNSSVKVGVPPGASSIKYRVTIKNVGNATLSDAVAYDVLPYLDDMGTTTATAGTPRGSTVKEQLATVSDVSAGVALAYSTSTNPPRPEVYSGSGTGDWSAPLADASSIRATVATLAPNQSESFVYEAALVDGSADQVACNSIAIAATGLVEVEPSPVCATTQEADFGIEATDRFPLQGGRVGTVPFEVTNHGGSDSSTGTVTITVPAEVSVASLAFPGWDCTAPSTDGPVEVTCEPVNGDGTTRSLTKDVPETLELQVKPATSAPAELCFDASVAGLMIDPEPENNTAQSCATALSAEPELLVSKNDGRPSVAVGEEYTYTVTASSRLVSEPIDDVSLTDTLPASLEFVSAVPTPTSVSGQTLSWDLGRLEAAGIEGDGGDLTSGGAGSAQSVAVTVRVLPGAQDSVTNTAVASGADPADSSITLSAQDDDVDVVTNVFTDLDAGETTPQNTPVTTALGDIASTTGAPLDPTAVTQATAPTHGTLTINPATGAVTYNPTPGYSGADSYQAQVCDTSSPDVQCFTATVDVTVGVNVVDAVDDSPVTAAGVAVSTNVRSNDSTQTGQALADPTIVSQPADGTVAVNADGTIAYTPDAGTSGPDSYTYRVCDTSNPDPVCDTATVNVTVENVWNETGTTVMTPQNTPVTTPLADIVTTDGAPIDVVSVAQSTPPAHGSISINPATGAVTYTPVPGYTGSDSYALVMCDEGAAACSAVTVQVEVGQNVVTAVDDSESTDAVTAVTTNVRTNDTSASGEPFADPTVTGAPAHGTATVNGAGAITYTPAAGFSGMDSYAYQVCDTSAPTAVCDTATVTVTVANVFTDEGASESTPQNTAVTTPVGDIVSTTGAPVDPATVTEATAPEHGTISIDPTTGAVNYEPEAGYSGSDSYEVRVCDASIPDAQCFTATVDITVEPNLVDAVDDTDATDAVTAVNTDVRDNDTSASGQALANPSVTLDPGHGAAAVNADGTITYTPASGFSGTDSYTYRVCDTSDPDPVCDTAVVTVQVANVFTDGPAAEGNLGVETPHNTPVTTPLVDIVTATGAPLDPATVAQETAPAHGAISVDPATGAVTYTPEPGYAGPDSYTVSVCDTSTPDTQCHQVPVAVTVVDNNVTAPDLEVDTRTNQTAAPIDVLAATVSASGQDLDPPTITDQPAHGQVAVTSDGIVYTPEDGYDGDDSFEYEVCDTSHPTPVCDTGTVTVTVTPVADLAAAKSLTSDQLIAGQLVTYEVALTNQGPSTATQVHSIDPVPAAILDPVGTPDDAVPGASCATRPTMQADLDRLDGAHGPYTVNSHPSVVDCTYPSVPLGTTVHGTISGMVDAGLKDETTVVNQAAVFAATYDPALDNNIGVVSTESAASADLVLTVTTGKRKVSDGDVVTVTFTVENRGPSDASGVVVDESITGLKLLESDVSGVSAHGGTWTIGDLASGDRVVWTARYRVTGQDTASVVGRVSAAAPADPNLDNNGGDACVSEEEGCGVVAFEVANAAADGGNGTDDGDALPDTGATLGKGALNLALGLIVAGAGVLLLGRRRRSQS
jgi:uncharacterized repeat protein (TIGR01451 family)